MKLLKPLDQLPSEYGAETRIFLAGSIEMGAAEMWQDKVASALSEYDDLIIFNPRRDDWDSSWVQHKDNEQFRKQVEWELRGQELSDEIIFYFDPNTKSPITLLEFGMATASYASVKVCCPEGYWRKGNVDIVCEKYGIDQYDTLDNIIDVLKVKLVERERHEQVLKNE